MKICTKCKQEKELKHFTYRADRNSHASACKDCLARQARIKRNGGEETNGFIPRSVNPDARYNFDITKPIHFKSNPKPIRCEYKLCQCIIPIPDSRFETKVSNSAFTKMKGQPYKFYCNDWCKEMAGLDRVKIRKCNRCDNSVSPIYNKKTNCIANWRELCEECAGRRDNSMSLKTVCV